MKNNYYESMEKLYKLVEGSNKRFPKGIEPFQMATRLLEECGEVTKEINHQEDTGIKKQKYGDPSKEKLANELRQAIKALFEIIIYYGVEKELELSINASLEQMKREGLIE